MSPNQTPTARYVQVAQGVPLIAALVAPLICLLDIPALSQRWFNTPEGGPQPDPVGSIVLSAFSLVFCVIGNVLLIARFSVNSKKLEAWALKLPLIAFWVKTAAEVINLAIYGRQGSERRFGESRDEGFWCAAFSCALSGIVAAMLLYHYAVQRHKTLKDSLKVRVDARHFAISMSSFVVLIATMALVFSRIEGWQFLDGCYFTITTITTVGFGDFRPTKTSTKVLLFPFAVLGIALLANQVSLIVGYFGKQSELRRTKWRAQRMALAKESREKDLKDSDRWGLVEEMKYLERLQKKEKEISQMYNMLFSIVCFVVFWTMGAVVFWAVDGISYGSSLYFCFVFFLTIGYGENTPTSPVARVFFIFYALVAVPVIASFAVQTVATVLSSISQRRKEVNRAAREARTLARKAKQSGDSGDSTGKSKLGRLHLHRPGKAEGIESSAEAAESVAWSEDSDEEDEEESEFEAHARFVVEHWGTLDNGTEEQVDQADAEKEKEDANKDDKDHKRKPTMEMTPEQLAKETAKLACALESQARALLIMALPRGGKAQTLLRADRNVQRRDVKALGISDDELTDHWDWEQKDIRPGASECSQLRSIRAYRQTFSHLLVTCARLQQLEGSSRDVFLRTNSLSGAKEGEAGARAEMEAMDDVDEEVEVESSGEEEGSSESGHGKKGDEGSVAEDSEGKKTRRVKDELGEKEDEDPMGAEGELNVV